MADMESEGDAAGGEHPASRDAGDGTQASAPNEQIAAQQFDEASDQFVRLAHRPSAPHSGLFDCHGPI